MSADIRSRLQQLMQNTLRDERLHGTWTYREVRPLSPPASWKPGQRVVGDCSKGVQYLCRWAGAPDPMGAGFAGWGNSTTIAAHLLHLATASELEVGDIVTFGPNGSAHAAMVLQTGADPLLWSFGHQGAPDTYRLSADHRPAQFLRLPVAPHKPTRLEQLRSETGYWAWLQWRLGEGAWRGLGKAYGVARPNVPRLIPLAWWRAAAAFLAARRKRRTNPPTR